MTRREVREHIIKLLYIKDFHEAEELNEQVEAYFEIILENKCSEDTKTEIVDRFQKVCEKLPEIDAIIADASSGWRINRIGKIELQCLRVAVYELKEDDSIPAKVSINEAVEFAKLFGGEHSYAFVNGVLAKLVPENG